MSWKNCNACNRSYNDTKGGCKNTACTSFDRNSVVDVQNSSKSVPIPSFVNPPFGEKMIISKGGGANGTPKPPKHLPTKVIATSVNLEENVSPDTPVVSWIETPANSSEKTRPQGIPIKAEQFNLICYRGEKSEWWPEPRMRLAAGGMHVFEPWPGYSMTDIWAKLVEEIKKRPGFNVKQKVADYAQYLRAEGRPFALASARTIGGAFEGYAYEIEIANARTFRWGKDYTLGPPANFTNTQKTSYNRIINQNVEVFTKDTIDEDYIVLNADTIAESTILGFGHKTGTYEVTFLHDLPISFVKTVNGNAVNLLNIYPRDILEKMADSKHKQTALKLFRN